MADSARRASRDQVILRPNVRSDEGGAFAPRADWRLAGERARRRVRLESVGVVGGRLGWMPLLSAVLGLGLLLEAFAFATARFGGPDAMLWFWLGLLVAVVPIAVRLAQPAVHRRERLALVIVLGLGLYLVKLLNSPASFTYYDELQHWATLDAIVQTGRLFVENRLLVVSSLYPGLEITTAAVVQVSGLSYFAAGVIVVGALRLVLIVALFTFIERVTRSSRIAGIALFVYVCNPSFVFFDSQFAYETMALSFAVLTLMAIAVRDDRSGGERAAWTVVALLALLTTTVSHHVTSFALAGFLVAWYLVTARRSQVTFPAEGPGWLAPVAVLVTVAWLVNVAGFVVDYLTGPLLQAVNGLLALISREQNGRQLFQSPTGTVAPIDERMTAIVGTLLLVAAIPLGCWYLWKRRPASPAVWLLAISAFAYPVTIVFRISSGGWQAAERSSAFLFVGLGVVAAFFVASRAVRRFRVLQVVVVAAVAAIVFRTGVIGGFPPFERLPGRYLVSADARSIDPESIGAATWARQVLGPNNRVAADRINNLLFGSYGNQDEVWYQTDQVDVSPIFLSSVLGPEQLALIRQGQIRYLVVDTRLSTDLPQLGEYYDDAEVAAGPHTSPVPLADLTKFDHIPGVSRVFDSGNIRVYDVSGLANGQ